MADTGGARPPSGEQVELVHGDQRATIVEVGGGIRTYDVGQRSVLDPYAIDARCDGGHGAPLLPWPNRLGGGRYHFAGEDHQLPLTEVERGNAIHGLTRWQPWTVATRSGHGVRMATSVVPQPGYPFHLDLTIDYRLDEDGLSVHTTATNVGAEACLYGAGQHPYLSPGAGGLDDCTLHLDATTRIVCDPERLLPTGVVPVEGTDHDLRMPTRIGTRQLDDAYTNLSRDDPGRAWVRLTGDDGRTVELWADATHAVLQVFTGDTLAAGRRRQGLAVEPMTCPADAFRTGDHLRVLAPGESLTTAWGVRLR